MGTSRSSYQVIVRREKFRPKGGPDGGDGGNGGNVILRVDPAVDNLKAYSYDPKLVTKNGEHGSGNRKHGKSTKEISRKDEIWVSQSGLVTIAGGKLTGYRKMAEDTVAEACKLMGREHRPSGDQLLPGGDINGSLDYEALILAQKFPMSDDRASRLVRLYGSESEQVMLLGNEPVVEDGFIMAGEILWAIEQEAASTLEDVLYRRTRAALYKPTEIEELIEPVADIMSHHLAWDEPRREQEIEGMRKRCEIDTRLTT